VTSLLAFCGHAVSSIGRHSHERHRTARRVGGRKGLIWYESRIRCFDTRSDVPLVTPRNVTRFGRCMCALHEQEKRAGLTIQFLGRRADRPSTSAISSSRNSIVLSPNSRLI
jgi:hypothetical protein